MRYYVISSDGQRYGPADVATLNQWATEGRLLPHQMLEDEASGIRTPASAIEGVVFPQGQMPPPGAVGGPVAQPYTGAAYAGVMDDGSKDMTPAWIFAALSLVCSCCYLGVIAGALGIYYSNQAKKKGHPSATAAMVLSIVGLVLSVVLIIAGMLIDTASVLEGFGR